MNQLTPDLLHALVIAGKPAEKVRDDLVDGQTYHVDCLIELKGTFSVGHRQPTSSSSSIPASLLIASLLAKFGPRKRIAIVDELVATLMTPPDPDDEQAVTVDSKSLQQAERLLRETTTTTPGTKRGNVSGKIVASVVDKITVPAREDDPSEAG